MSFYYSKFLSGERLKRVYDIAPPRTKQYLRAEVDFVLSVMKKGAFVLDLGCGYGRVIPDLLKGGAGKVTGIDSSMDNIRMGREFLRGLKDWELLCMDAGDLGFKAGSFDTVVCIQNGLYTFKVDAKRLIKESLRVCRSGGTLLFSSYSEKFWEHRLEWFRMQSAEGLLGEIDFELTKNGEIVCKDGFKAVTYKIEDFEKLTDDLGLNTEIAEVDDSSVFCIIDNRKH